MSELTSMPVNRAERRKQQTRERIKQAVAELMQEYDYQALTIQAITNRADIGYGTFYLHFADKDEAVWAILYDMAQTYREQVDQDLADTAHPHKEYLGWLAIFRYVDRVRTGFAAYFGSQGSVKLFNHYQAYLKQMIEENIRESRYSPDLVLPTDFTAQYMAGALMRLLVWWCETPNDYTAEHMADMLYQIVYRNPPAWE